VETWLRCQSRPENRGLPSQGYPLPQPGPGAEIEPPRVAVGWADTQSCQARPKRCNLAARSSSYHLWPGAEFESPGVGPGWKYTASSRTS
jgi:hypothetical protein